MINRGAHMTSYAHFGCQVVTKYGNNSMVNFLSINIIVHCSRTRRSLFIDKSIENIEVQFRVFYYLHILVLF